MTYEEALAKAKDLVTSAKEVVIVTHTQPNMDSMGSSLALMLGIVSLGKKATVVCPDAMTVGLSSFVGIDKVVRDFGKKNFVISLDYVDGSIEKVSYNIEGKKFKLVVEHRPGYELINADNVGYSYQGVSADLIISVDTLNFGQLGPVYELQKETFAGTPIINVDFHNENTNYGALNLVDPGASSTTELVAELLATLGVKLTQDIATNLLNAVYSATNNFQNPNVTSMAFEVASVCLKAGAVRFGVDAPRQPMQAMADQVAPSSGAAGVTATKPPVEEPRIFVNNQPVTPKQSAHVQPVQVTPVHTEPHDQVQHAAPQAEVPEVKKPVTPPSDWLKPKIFKSSGSLV